MPLSTPEAQREYQRQWIARRRAEFFADKSCVKCGSTEDLQLDHIDWRTKIANSIWSWSKSRRDAEIAKCQVLCKPCHKDKTFYHDMPEQGYCIPTSGTAHHGTWGRVRRKCRCGLCLLKARNYRRARSGDRTRTSLRTPGFGPGATA